MSPISHETLLNTQRNSKPSQRPAAESRRLRRSASKSNIVNDLLSLKIGSLFTEQVSEESIDDGVSDAIPLDLNDTKILGPLVKQAILDTEEFPVLTAEKFLEKKKALVQITNSFESCQNQLSLELNVVEASENIIKFNSADRNQMADARKQLKNAETKIENLTKGFFDLMQSFGTWLET
jgi:hypothetical protein